jgi:DNA helicase-2/ATP-dependent DNA helicase PcrA
VVTAVDPALERFTAEQLVAAASPLSRVFIEAEPGSGKTTVAAQRFGVRRYALARRPDGRLDDRGVIAVSFTRSATSELHGRVVRSWGPSALRWPHRIVTVDTLLYELLEYLLATDQICWPGGHRRLEVRDSWQALAEHQWTRVIMGVRLNGRTVVVTRRLGDAASRAARTPFVENVHGGVCTHEEVRSVLASALKIHEVAESITGRMAATLRAVIVDEVFDANDLDL